MNCGECGRKAQTPLCNRCTQQLAQILTELSWLLGELKTTITRKDKLTLGAPRHNSHTNPINLAAADLHDHAATTLAAIVDDLTQNALTLQEAPPQLLAVWLRQNVRELQHHPNAPTHYRALKHLAGHTSPRGGPIHDLINRPDRRFAGPCPECETMCYAYHDDIYTSCPECRIPIDVEKNRARTIAKHDLMPEKLLLTTLDNYGAHVPRVTLYAWITTGRLPICGYLSTVNGHPAITPRRAARHDPRVYSLSRALILRHKQL